MSKKLIFTRGIPSVFLILCDILLFVGTVLISPNGVIGKIIVLALNLLLNLWGAIIFFDIFSRLYKYINDNNNFLIIVLKKHSMGIYLIHQQIIYVVILVLNGISPFLHGFLNFVISITFSLMIIESMEWIWRGIKRRYFDGTKAS